MFPEALMLHYLDDLDSKIESMRAHFEREATRESPWTSYNGSLGRPLLNTAKFLAQAPDPRSVAAGAAALADGPAPVASARTGFTETPTLPGVEGREKCEQAAAVAA